MLELRKIQNIPFADYSLVTALWFAIDFAKCLNLLGAAVVVVAAVAVADVVGVVADAVFVVVAAAVVFVVTELSVAGSGNAVAMVEYQPFRLCMKSLARVQEQCE